MPNPHPADGCEGGAYAQALRACKDSVRGQGVALASRKFMQLAGDDTKPYGEVVEPLCGLFSNRSADWIVEAVQSVEHRLRRTHLPSQLVHLPPAHMPVIPHGANPIIPSALAGEHAALRRVASGSGVTRQARQPTEGGLGSRSPALRLYAKMLKRDRDTGVRMDALLRGADWAQMGTSETDEAMAVALSDANLEQKALS
jgi:hypothetical protein